MEERNALLLILVKKCCNLENLLLKKSFPSIISHKYKRVNFANYCFQQKFEFEISVHDFREKQSQKLSDLGLGRNLSRKILMFI